MVNGAQLSERHTGDSKVMFSIPPRAQANADNVNAPRERGTVAMWIGL